MRRLLPLALVLLLALASPAAGGVGLTLAQDSASPARSDGLERIAYMAAPGRLQLLGYRGRPLYALDVSEGCPAARRLVALGGGQVLLECEPAGDVSRLAVETATLHAIPGTRQAIDEAMTRTLGFGAFTDIGAYGVRFEATAYHESPRVSTLDWRTGSLSPAPESATTTQELDQPDFVAPLCPPLRRAPRSGPFATAPYDPVWWGWRDVVFERRGVGLTVERCDTGRVHVLWPAGRGRQPLTDVQYAAGLVTWTVPRTPDRIRLGVRLHGYLSDCGVSVSWRLAPFAQAAHVRGGVVLSESAAAGGPWAIRRIPLRGVCVRTLRAWSMTVIDGDNAALTSPRSATLRLPRSGSVATSVVPTWPVRRTVRPRDGLRLQLGTIPGIVRSFRARLGDGAWRKPGRRRLDWHLPLPPVAAPQPLTIEVRYRSGGTARYLLRVAPPS